jgi:hypothetical protein
VQHLPSRKRNGHHRPSIRSTVQPLSTQKDLTASLDTPLPPSSIRVERSADHDPKPAGERVVCSISGHWAVASVGATIPSEQTYQSFSDVVNEVLRTEKQPFLEEGRRGL